MEINKELLTKAKEAKTAEELKVLAEENGMQLPAEQAEKAFADLHKTGEMADEELDNVAGGGCLESSCPKCGCKERSVQYSEKVKALAWCCSSCGEFIDLYY